MGAALRTEPSRLWPEPEPRTLDTGRYVSYPILSSWRAQMMTLKEQRNRGKPVSRARHIMSVVVLAGGWRWQYSLYARPNPPLRQCLRRRCRNASALRSAVLVYTRAQDGSVVEATSRTLTTDSASYVRDCVNEWREHREFAGAVTVSVHRSFVRSPVALPTDGGGGTVSTAPCPCAVGVDVETHL